MNHDLLTLKLRSKRDVLRARQRARQIARLLGYEALEQSWIAASVFDMGRKALPNRPVLVIRLEPELLRFVVAVAKKRENRNPPSVAQLVLPLPEKASSIDRDDISWIIRQLNRITPLDVFEEFHLQNLELLQLSSLLRRHQECVGTPGSAA